MILIEVFKTNVETTDQAARLIHSIQERFPDSTVNFDLDDCDRILRFQTHEELIPTEQLFLLVREAGFTAEILSDEIPPFVGSSMMLSHL